MTPPTIMGTMPNTHAPTIIVCNGLAGLKAATVQRLRLVSCPNIRLLMRPSSWMDAQPRLVAADAPVLNCHTTVPSPPRKGHTQCSLGSYNRSPFLPYQPEPGGFLFGLGKRSRRSRYWPIPDARERESTRGPIRHQHSISPVKSSGEEWPGQPLILMPGLGPDIPSPRFNLCVK